MATNYVLNSSIHHTKYNNEWVNEIQYKSSPSATAVSVWTATHSGTTWVYDTDKHWKQCTICSALFDTAAHQMSGGTDYDSTGHWSTGTCTVCGYISTGTKYPHNMSWTSNASTHWKYCDGCAYTSDSGSHTESSSWSTSSTQHWKECTVCSRVTTAKANHTPSGWQTDSAGHWKQCTTCSYITTTKTAHTEKSTWETNASGHWKICSVCSYVTTASTSHTPSSWQTDSEGHWKICTVCSYTTTSKASHTPSGWQSDANQHWKQCTTCSYITTAKTNHTEASTWSTDANQHWKICTTCSYITTAKANHTPSTSWSTDANQHWKVCTTCSYITTAKANHGSATYIYTTNTGFTTHTKVGKCPTCNYQLSSTSESCSAASGTSWSSDNSYHWKACQYCSSGKASYATHTYDQYGSWTYLDTTQHTRTVSCVCGKATSNENQNHTWSTTWSTDSTNHWKICTICNSGENSKGTHAAAGYNYTANNDTTHKVTCKTCSYIVNSAQNHSFGSWSAYTYSNITDTTHTASRSHTCTNCSRTVTETNTGVAHTFGSSWGGYNSSQHWKICTLCGGGKGSATSHGTLVWTYDTSNHWQKCQSDCGYTTNSAAHTMTATSYRYEESTSTVHIKYTTYDCSSSNCGYSYEDTGVNENHDLRSEYRYSTTQHWLYYYCNMGCGYSYEGTKTNHSMSWTYNNSQHWKECSSNCGYTSNTGSHSLIWTYNTSNHWQKCSSDCGYTTNSSAHSMSATSYNYYQSTSTVHIKKPVYTCSNSNCAYSYEGSGTNENHTDFTWYDYTSSQHRRECSRCGYAETGNHSMSWAYNTAEHWKVCSAGCGHITDDGPHTTSSYIDYDATHHWTVQYCTASCGYSTTYGTTTHSMYWDWNTTKHWQYCSGCDYTTTKTNHSMTIWQYNYYQSTADVHIKKPYYHCSQSGCEYEYEGSGENEYHNGFSWYSISSSRHRRDCENCGYYEVASHSMGSWSKYNYAYVSDSSHSYDASRSCTAGCGRTEYTSGTEGHTFVGGVCSKCGYEPDDPPPQPC